MQFFCTGRFFEQTATKLWHKITYFSKYHSDMRSASKECSFDRIVLEIFFIGKTNKTVLSPLIQVTCTETYVSIPGTSTPGGRHCSTVFNSAAGMTLPSTVVSSVTGPGFTFDTFSAADLGVAATTAALSGYSLDYNQVLVIIHEVTACFL